MRRLYVRVAHGRGVMLNRMDFKLDDSIPVLERTPALLNAMLNGLDDKWTRSNYGEDTFSPFDVVGHLILGERTDWMGRIKHVLSRNAEPFRPFDRYGMYEGNKNRSMNELLDEFA